jgi:ribosomal protein S18 acetylase RimI-like enzyme
MVIVNPQWHRKGLGSMLINAVSNKFPKANFYLEVENANDAAIHLYTKCGFKTIDEVAGYQLMMLSRSTL